MLIKRKNNKEKKKLNRSQLLYVGSFLILLGMVIAGSINMIRLANDKMEDFKIKEFYEEQEKIDTNVIEEIPEEDSSKKVVNTPNYIAVIKIPKIKLEKGLCSKGSSCNKVNNNIQILNESTYPDVVNGNFILAGHSGSGYTAFFKDVYKLKLDDEIYVVYGGFEYKYKIVNMYDIEKTGTANIIRNKEKSTLTLVTCRHNTDKQIIVISELVERAEYNG